MKAVQLVLLSDDKSAWNVITVSGAPSTAPRCLLVVPGAHVLAREVDAVGATLAQSQAAAIAALAPELAAPATQSVCATGPVRHGRRTVFLVSNVQLRAWLDAARAKGFAPSAVLPDFALLPEPAPGEALIADRGDLVVRTPTRMFSCQPELAAQLISGLRETRVAFEDMAIMAVRSATTVNLPNLMSAASKRSSIRPARLYGAAGAAFAALVIAAVTPWISAGRLNAETAALRTEAETVARSALPGEARIVDPLAQLREAGLPRRMAEAGLTAAAGVVEGLQKTVGVRVSRLDVMDDGTVRAAVAASDLGQLAPLREHLSGLGLHVAETPGPGRANSVTIDLTVSSAS